MRKLTNIAVLLVGFSLSGCMSSLPIKGLGGMAEHNSAGLDPVMPDRNLGPQHGLRFELNLAERHLDILVLEGAELCFPATVVQAKKRNNRISRELQGGLKFDAANDLIIQRKLLARLERQLDYVKRHDVCVLPLAPEQQKPGDMGARIYALLNSEHQFVGNSSELDPEYVSHLATAARWLHDQPQYRLRVTGHSDVSDGKKQAKTLSLARANKIGRYLQIFGLPKNHIQIDAIDIAELGSETLEAASNRHRVSIELVEVMGDGAQE